MADDCTCLVGFLEPTRPHLWLVRARPTAQGHLGRLTGSHLCVGSSGTAAAGDADVKERIDQSSQDTVDDGRIVEDGGELATPPLPLGAAFPIVGVGASAGGLDAFTQLLRHLPIDTGMGFVLVQHLDPTHASFSARCPRESHDHAGQPGRGRHERSSRTMSTSSRPTPTSRIRRPADARVETLDGRGSHLSVDGFLRSLAADHGSHAIGVVLSGNASDGTEGLRAIKAGERHHPRAGPRLREVRRVCPATRSMRVWSTMRWRFPSSPPSSCG